jgi:hypothetical protein
MGARAVATRTPATPSWATGQSVVYLVQAAAFCLLAGSWWAISDTGTLERQVNLLLPAVAALCVCLTACLGWVFVGRRRIALRRAQLAVQVAARFPGPSTASDGARRAVLVAADSMTRYHRPGCQLVRGKDVRPDTRPAHEQAARRACGLCRP